MRRASFLNFTGRTGLGRVFYANSYTWICRIVFCITGTFDKQFTNPINSDKNYYSRHEAMIDITF